MTGEEEPPVVLDFRKDTAPRVDMFEKIAASPDYAMTVLDYIQRQHPDMVLERIPTYSPEKTLDRLRENSPGDTLEWIASSIHITVLGTDQEAETEVEWA